MIEIEGLTKSFGHIKAVDDIFLEIQRGEVVGFLGPNGAGKTTTMRLITGFLSPDEGTVKVNGIPVEKNRIEAQRYIGYLPENNPLYKDMLVSEFLGLSADLKNIPASKRRSAFDFVVDAVNIGDVFYRPISELSKGYKQRVGIAAALLHEPPILIMDEPTEGLDPNQRTEIRSLIKDLARDHTIVVSTHVMQEAQAVCNRLVIINRGRVVADGTSEDLSRAAQKKRTLVLDLEGRDVEESLKNIPGVEEVIIESVNGERIRAKLVIESSLEIQPYISRLVAAHGWIIWRLTEEEYRLEEIFYRLTMEI